MLAASLLPAPQLPEALATVLWAIALLAVGVAGIWRLLEWDRKKNHRQFGQLLRSEEFGEVLQRHFGTALRSDDFEAVVDRRVGAAFNGALAPLLAAQTDIAGKAQTAKDTADAAHRRIDEHLERHG
jgi:hypothetical protein